MTRTEKAFAEKMSVEMANYTKKQWATFNKTYASHVAIASKLEIHKMAYKLFLEETEDKLLEAGGHKAQVTTRAGGSYVDYAGLLAELEEQGIDTQELIKRHTKHKPEQVVFTFK